MSVEVKRRSKITVGEIIKNISEFDDKAVAIGIWDKGPTPAENLAYRMAVHEKGYTVPRAYGGGPPAKVPARPVFGSTFKDYKKAANKFIEKDLYPKLVAGKIDVDTAIAMLGSWYEGKLKEQFRKKKFKPLSKYYRIRPSGKPVTPSSIPLIDDGTMRKAIKWMEV